MPSAPDLAGSVLDGRYELHSLIGEGTFGRVYRGLDRRLRRSVAVKVIKPWWADDPEWAERFEREAQMLARLSDPGIVQIFDVGQSEEGLYYVAELVEGESLAARLRRGALAVEGAREIAEQLCRALAHTHAADVIHRDIKPANVLLGPNGRVKLGDFSIARLAEGSTDGPPTVAGTPKYMAPEQARGEAATAATDIYSVGVVLYEMLAGRPPFDGSSPVELALRHLQDPPPPLPESVPSELAAVVRQALEKAPEQRYSSAAAMGAALARTRSTAVMADDPTARMPAARPAPAPMATSTPAGTPAAGGDADAGDRTREAPRFGPRRDVNPPARRRAAALIAAVALLVAVMAAAALVIGNTSHVRVPRLTGLDRARAMAAVRRAALTAHFSTRYSPGRRGTAISQSPAAGRQVDRHSDVEVVLSAGPAPVRLRGYAGQTEASAATALAGLGLRMKVRPVPGAGATPNTVVAQSPAAGTSVPARSTITLSVAEAPRWRTVTSFSGTDAGRSGTFRIQGDQWRVIYTMSYVGTCTLIVFCDGPTAHVTDVTAGQDVNDFGLKRGSARMQSFTSGPGEYRIDVTPGDDTAAWSFEVQDRY